MSAYPGQTIAWNGPGDCIINISAVKEKPASRAVTTSSCSWGRLLSVISAMNSTRTRRWCIKPGINVDVRSNLVRRQGGNIETGTLVQGETDSQVQAKTLVRRLPFRWRLICFRMLLAELDRCSVGARSEWSNGQYPSAAMVRWLRIAGPPSPPGPPTTPTRGSKGGLSHS